MKINCLNPNHIDNIPSMEIYDKIAYCFVCNYVIPTDGLDLGKGYIKRPENIHEKLQYIKTLPEKEIRGLYFPYDESGFYIVWPNQDFYKKRLFRPIKTTRYLAPRGVSPPLFEYKNCNERLIIIEGEINAQSLQISNAIPATIASPGSADSLLKHMSYYLTYLHIHVIVDKDNKGVAQGWVLKQELTKAGKTVQFIALEKDLNEILQDGGFEAVKAWAKTNLAL